MRPTITMTRLLTIGALVLLLAGGAAAQTITWIGQNFPLDISADGKVVAGNIGGGTYHPFRWTSETGVVVLEELALSPGGTPDISDDGNHVSATVVSTPDSVQTFGIWTKGIGWETYDPAGLDTMEIGSCWGLSGDGQTAVGFMWERDPATDYTAVAATFNRDGTFTVLPTPMRNCRANDASYDGSVVVGWSERFDGVWQPTVWENGGVEVLHHGEWWTEAQCISPDGNLIAGTVHDTISDQREAALWIRDGDGWDQQNLGVLSGTFAGYGQAIPRDMTADGSMIVGYNAFDWNNAAGFVWTLEQGMQTANDFLTAAGVTLPPMFHVAELRGISDNGKFMIGSGYYSNVFPRVYEGFIVDRGAVSAVGDAPRVAVGGLNIDGNHPNPFNPATEIFLSVARDQQVQLDVFDLRGRLVRNVFKGSLTAGRHGLSWDGRDGSGRSVASGVYFARARGDRGSVGTHRMTLLK